LPIYLYRKLYAKYYQITNQLLALFLSPTQDICHLISTALFRKKREISRNFCWQKKWKMIT